VTLPESPGPSWIRNEGIKPEWCERVRVVLANGTEPVYADALTPTCKPGWAAATTRWTLTASLFDVAWFLPL
jgi:hypothetical protein